MRRVLYRARSFNVLLRQFGHDEPGSPPLPSEPQPGEPFIDPTELQQTYPHPGQKFNWAPYGLYSWPHVGQVGFDILGISFRKTRPYHGAVSVRGHFP